MRGLHPPLGERPRKRSTHMCIPGRAEAAETRGDTVHLSAQAVEANTPDQEGADSEGSA